VILRVRPQGSVLLGPVRLFSAAQLYRPDDLFGLQRVAGFSFGFARAQRFLQGLRQAQPFAEPEPAEVLLQALRYFAPELSPGPQAAHFEA
jgi:hypothetical protein